MLSRPSGINGFVPVSVFAILPREITSAENLH